MLKLVACFALIAVVLGVPAPAPAAKPEAKAAPAIVATSYASPVLAPAVGYSHGVYSSPLAYSAGYIAPAVYAGGYYASPVVAY